MTIVALGAVYYPDPTKDKPIWNGDIYVGFPDTDPEIASNQKQATLRMEDGSEVPTAQPIKTGSGGVPMDSNGNTAMRILVDGNYSLKVLDRNGAQKYYIADSSNEETGGGVNPLVESVQTLLDGQVLVPFPIDLSYASFYINGSDVDIGRLNEPDDYTVDYTLQEVTLARSYPAGTKITAAYNETGTPAILSQDNTWTGDNNFTEPLGWAGKKTLARGRIIQGAVQSGSINIASTASVGGFPNVMAITLGITPENPLTAYAVANAMVSTTGIPLAVSVYPGDTDTEFFCQVYNLLNTAVDANQQDINLVVFDG